VREKKVPKKTLTWVAKRKKENGQLEFTTLVNRGTGRDEKGAPINAPSIHIGALVGAGSLWPSKCFHQVLQ
jgi:hypothetical protein